MTWNAILLGNRLAKCWLIGVHAAAGLGRQYGAAFPRTLHSRLDVDSFVGESGTIL